MLRPFLLAATLLLPVPAAANGTAGPYLAARLAGFSNDYAAAARYYDRLLASDGEAQPQVLENAVIIYSALGAFDRAADAAERLDAQDMPSQFGRGARLVDLLDGGDLTEAAAMVEEGVGGALLDGLLRGWIAAAEGDLPAAEVAMETLAERSSFAPIARLHQASMRAATGDFEGAEAILSGEAFGALSLSARDLTGHVQVLAELGRTDDALALIEAARATGTTPALEDLARRLEAGEPVSYDLVPDARAGMAEAYFTLAAILTAETSPTFALINARAAAALKPDHADALVLAGELLRSQERYALADAVLKRVPGDDPAFFTAEITRADVLLASGRDEAAIEVLQALTRTHPGEQSVWIAFGDTLRRLERWEESAAAYDRAVGMIDEAGPRDWFLFYARGIARERQEDWDAAEADFRRALELNPGQPLVLNYLGYGLVEQRIKLDEALDMIERAVSARPDDGYITDSLGWVLYRLGRYDEAVEPMERAVQLRPLDPIINDHLGDVLWTVGRAREAEFQWKRALSLDPEPEDEARIRRKLEVGLDVVLEAEGGKGPIEAADN